MAVITAAALIGCAVSLEKDKAKPPPGKTAVTPLQQTEESGDAGTFGLCFITTGNEDVFLLEAPDRTCYLVDTGESRSYRQIARLLRVQGVSQIEGIFLTHLHGEQLGNLQALLTAFSVRQVYIPRTDEAGKLQTAVQVICQNRGTQVTALQGGETFSLGGITAEIPCSASGGAQRDAGSFSMRIVHKNNVFLLTEDAALQPDTLNFAAGESEKADVLKIGGGPYTVSQQFLDRAEPEYLLLSGTDNEIPDPVNEQIRRCTKQEKPEVYYSESDGLGMRFVSNGESIAVQPVYDRELPCTLYLSISQADRENQRMTIRNEGAQSAPLDGCLLISERGNECFVFPEGITLEPGGEVTVSAAETAQEGDLIWGGVWSEEQDEARLYDKNINLLAQDPR